MATTSMPAGASSPSPPPPPEAAAGNTTKGHDQQHYQPVPLVQVYHMPLHKQQPPHQHQPGHHSSTMEESRGLGEEDGGITTTSSSFPHHDSSSSSTGDAIGGLQGGGGGRIFEVRPAVLHFGGLEPNKVHRQVVHIINCSRSPERLVVLPPRTPHIRLEYSKRGVVAPGMSQAVTVTFTPQERRYHYDVLRIRTKGGGDDGEALQQLCVPIHGYPVMNVAIFPTRIDMGHCPLHETTAKTVKLTCKVPLPFDYELVVLRGGHPHFRVWPLSGTVPANGHVDIHIHFTPQCLKTCFLELHVWVSQYNFQPFTCTVVASSLPGHVRRRALVQAAAELGLLQPPPSPSPNHHHRRQRGSPQGRAGGGRSPLGVLVMKGEEESSIGEEAEDRAFYVTTGTTANQPQTTPPRRPHSPQPVHQDHQDDHQQQQEEHDGGAGGGGHAAAGGGGGGGGRPLPSANESSSLCRALVLQQQRGGEGASGADLWECLDHYEVDPPRTPVRFGGSGAAFDAGGQWLAAAKKAAQARRRRAAAAGAAHLSITSTQKLQQEVNHHQHIAEGLKIPQDLSSMAAVNFVLTQQPGKLKPKDLQAAIEDVRQARAEQKAQQETIRTMTAAGAGNANTGGGGGVPLTSILAELQGPQQTRQLKELVFLQDVREMEVREKEREFKASEQVIGQRTLRPVDVDRIRWVRASLALQAKRAARDNDRGRTQTLATGPHPKPPNNKAARAETVLGYRPCHVPDFDVYKAGEWRQRTATARRLVHQASKVMVQRRAGVRLLALQRWLGLPHTKRTREEVRRMVEEENEAAGENSGGQGAGGKGQGQQPAPLLCVEDPSDFGGIDGSMMPPFHIDLQQVRDPRFPIWEEGPANNSSHQDDDEEEEEEEEAAAVAGGSAGGVPAFNDQRAFKLREPQEAAVMGYSNELKQPASSHYYPPVELDRPLRDTRTDPPQAEQPPQAAPLGSTTKGRKA